MTVGPATSPTTIGVLGLGRMGLPIAGWLTRAGFDVSGFDIRAERISLAVDVAGVTPATSAEQLASEVDLVVTILPGAPEFAQLMTRDSPVLAAMRPGSGWLDLTSNDPRVARAALELSVELGLFGVGAPMGGGVEAAEGRTLRFYVGARDRDLAAVRPVLEALGGDGDGTPGTRGTPGTHVESGPPANSGASGTSAIEHVGPAIEDGYVAKLLANQLWFGQVIAVTESLLLGQKLGLAPAALAGVLARSAGSSTFLEQHVEHLLDGDYLATFGLDRCVEELQILSALAEATATPFALGDLVTRLHEDALARFGSVDGELMAARMLEERAGATLRAH